MLQFFPIRFCYHCKNSTSATQRLCERCIIITVRLRVFLPSDIVEHFIGSYISSCEYEVNALTSKARDLIDYERQSNRIKCHSKSYNNHNWRNH